MKVKELTRVMQTYHASYARMSPKRLKRGTSRDGTIINMWLSAPLIIHRVHTATKRIEGLRRMNRQLNHFIG